MYNNNELPVSYRFMLNESCVLIEKFWVVSHQSCFVLQIEEPKSSGQTSASHRPNYISVYVSCGLAILTCLIIIVTFAVFR